MGHSTGASEQSKRTVHQGEFLDDFNIFSIYRPVEVKQSHFYKPDSERILRLCEFHLSNIDIFLFPCITVKSMPNARFQHKNHQ